MVCFPSVAKLYKMRGKNILKTNIYFSDTFFHAFKQKLFDLSQTLFFISENQFNVIARVFAMHYEFPSGIYIIFVPQPAKTLNFPLPTDSFFNC